MERLGKILLTVFFVSLIGLCGCKDLIPRDTSSLLIPRLQRPGIFGFVAGFGTTFAAVPDLVAILKRRSSTGMEPADSVHHRRFSGALDILRPADCFPARDRLECGRRID